MSAGSKSIFLCAILLSISAIILSIISVTKNNDKEVPQTTVAQPTVTIVGSDIIEADELLINTLRIHEIFGQSDIIVNDNFDMSGNRVKNVAMPQDEFDIANKKYVDTTFYSLSGTTPMQGDLNMDMNRIINVDIPEAPGDIVTKDYVDTRFLSTLGGYMQGDLIMNFTNTITNLPLAPTNPQDAASKGYVDSLPYLLRTGGTMNAVLDMGNNEITNIKDPSDAQDAVTKNYADTNYFSASEAIVLSENMNANGNTVVNVSDPTNPQDAMTKNYADTNYFLLDGSSSMLGPIDMGNNKIEYLLDPTDPGDAATKSYVDNRTSRSGIQSVTQSDPETSTTVLFDLSFMTAPIVVISLTDSVNIPNISYTRNVTPTGFELVTLGTIGHTYTFYYISI
jgi:hypothetical protein